MWAALLANAMIDGGSRVRRDFFEAVQKMEPEDVLMLDVVRRSTAVRAAGNSTVRAQLFIREEPLRLGLSENRVQISLQALMRLKCITMGNAPGYYLLTAFGHGLTEACSLPVAPAQPPERQ
jgi:hypothetical protein